MCSSTIERMTGRLRRSVNCLPTAGIGSGRAGLHPVQERLSRAHGSQCGFCTPGAVIDPASVLARLHRSAGWLQWLRLHSCILAYLRRRFQMSSAEPKVMIVQRQ